MNGFILKHEHCFSFNKCCFSSVLQSHFKIKWMFVVQVCLPSQLWAKCCARSEAFCPWRWSATMCVTRATWGPSSEQLQRLGARKSWPPKVSVFLKTSQTLLSHPPAQHQGHHTINHRPEERGMERGSARRSSLKGRERAIVNQMNIRLRAISRQCCGNFWEMWWSTHGLFRVHRYNLELN